MFVLDLFNNDHERRLAEGAVDQLEQRRIDDLAMKMDDLVARAKNPAYKKNPAALAALMKEFQKCKAERDSYYKIRNETMGYGSLGEGQMKQEMHKAAERMTLTQFINRYGDEEWVREFWNNVNGPMDEAGIPGNVPTEKIPGKEDLLKGKGRSYYESQKKNSEEVDEGRMSEIDAMRQDLKLMSDRQFYTAYGISKTAFQQKYRTLLKPALDEHGGGIGPRQHWQDLMPEQTNPEDDDWYDDEDSQTELRSGDYVRDTMDGESGEIFRMQGDPYERRVRILDRDGKGWYIEPSRLTRVDPQDPDVQRYFGKKRVRDMDEATGDSKFDAMMGKIKNDPWTRLNSDPNWEVEIEELVSKHIEPWLSAMEKANMPITLDDETLNPGWRKRYEQASTQLAQKYLASKKFNPRDPDLVNKIRAAIDWHTNESNSVHGQLSAYADDLPLQLYANDLDADEKIADLRAAMFPNAQDEVDDDGYAIRPRPDADPRRLDPGNMEEAVDSKGALKSAQAAAKFIIRNLDDRAALKYYSQDFWSPEKFYQGATMAMRGAGYDEIVKQITQDRPAQFESGVAEDSLDEISRRDFLKGAGATAGLAAIGAPKIASANSPYINSFTYRQIDKIIVQSLFLYNHTKDWPGKEQIARQMMQHINNYLAMDPNRKSVVTQMYQQVQQLTNNTKQNNPERYDTQRNNSLKHVDNLNLSWQFIFDNFKNNQTPTNENVEEVDETASPDAVVEGWSDAMVARRTGGARTPYSVYIKGKKWKDFENEDLAQAVANKLRAKFKADGRDPETVTIAPTDYDQPIKEDNDSEAVERAILNRIMVAHTDLLMKFGPDKVMQAAEEVAYNVGDVDEIGTSDVSAYVHQVKQILGVPEELDEKWSQKYKSSINCANPKGFSQKAHCAGRKK